MTVEEKFFQLSPGVEAKFAAAVALTFLLILCLFFLFFLLLEFALSVPSSMACSTDVVDCMADQVRGHLVQHGRLLTIYIQSMVKHMIVVQTLIMPHVDLFFKPEHRARIIQRTVNAVVCV